MNRHLRPFGLKLGPLLAGIAYFPLHFLAVGIGLTLLISPHGVGVFWPATGTLFAFLTVAAGVMILRKRDPERHRPFRAPGVWIVAPLAMAGCAFLMFSLPLRTQLTFFIWVGIGLLVYAVYGYGRSPLGQSGNSNGSTKQPAPAQD